MRIAIAQLNYTVGDLEGNAGKIVEAGRAAAKSGARLLVTSELAICGYPPLDLLNQVGFVEDCWTRAREIAVVLGNLGLALLIGTPKEEAGSLFNAAVLFDGDKEVGTHRKCLLPTYDVFDEERWFVANPEASRCIEFEDLRFGVHICEDAWNQAGFWEHYTGEAWRGRHTYARDPIRELIDDGSDLLINLSASPWSAELGPPRQAWPRKNHTDARRELCKYIQKTFGRDLLLVNQVGGNDGLLFDGCSFAASDDDGTGLAVIAWEEEVVVFDFEQKDGITLDWKGKQPKLVRERDWDFYATSKARLHFDIEKGPRQETESAMDCILDYHDEQGLLLIDIQAALELGVRDYVHKTGHSEVIIGLSGGIDSALVTTIACHALGPEHVRCIGMPTRFSSEGSVADAKILCENLGCRFDVIPIEEAFEHFETMLPGLEGLAIENVQPRIRGTILMALANQSGALVLAPGNKSELAVGYSTLYGDTVGCLEVIGDLYKTEVYRLARFYNRCGELIPQAIIDKEPSAELRDNQRDSDSLPDYEVLDPILRLYIEYARGVEEIIQNTEFDEATVRKVCRLVDLAEFKRRQTPMVLRVSQRAFGAGRQMPVVNGYRPKR
ncbi:MAG: NAD+ synthase [Planctomycetes bacterium]|nr:NAD+ synthase [Planctomycetota bacterium]